MTTLDDLIARLSAATRADRGLDALIAAHTGWDGWTIEEWEPFTRGEPGKDWAPEHPPVMDRCPAYTGSLDAAIPGEDIRYVEKLKGGDYWVRAWGACGMVESQHASEAIARRIAALKARKARP